MRAEEFLTEGLIAEAPLPPDWDTSQYGPGSTFKARLAYALERAWKLGTGSSRVAMTIEYQGRPTVLKVAKNQKGLAQNNVEASILSDGYAQQLGILIPIIDYDTQNQEPTWLHTEMAEKASEKQLCNVMKCHSLFELVTLANSIAGRDKWSKPKDRIAAYLQQGNRTQADADILMQYAEKLAELASSYEVELGDFTYAANWGWYPQGHPIIIDVGFSRDVATQYYKK